MWRTDAAGPLSGASYFFAGLKLQVKQMDDEKLLSYSFNVSMVCPLSRTEDRRLFANVLGDFSTKI